MDTSDLSSIISSLSEDDIEQLKSAAQSIFGGQGEQSDNEYYKEERDRQENSNHREQQSASMGFDPSMLGKIGNIMGLLNNNSKDKRCALISTLKPLLSEERQHKADEAMRMVQLLELIPKLREQGIF